MVSHVDVSAMRSAAFLLATTPLQGWRENDYRTTGNTGNTGNSKEWPKRPGEMVTNAPYATGETRNRRRNPLLKRLHRPNQVSSRAQRGTFSRRRPTSRNRPISADFSRLAHSRSGLTSRTLVTTGAILLLAAFSRAGTVYQEACQPPSSNTMAPSSRPEREARSGETLSRR